MNSNTPVKGNDISIVVPFHNEEDHIEELYRRLKTVMEATGLSYQLIFVDDGSADNTVIIMRRIKKSDPRVVAVMLTKNFGQTPALKAGIDLADGDIVITMDGDLQHSPEEIPVFIKKINEGYDLASGWRKRRTDNLFIRVIPSRVANWFLKLISGLDIHDFGTTFKAYRKELLQNIEIFGESHRFIPVLAARIGARVIEVPIGNPQRATGKSHYGLNRVFRVFSDLVFLYFFMGYLTRPMFLFGSIAMFFAGIGLIIPSTMMVLFFTGAIKNLQGHQNLLLFSVLMILVGLQFFCFGVIGEMLSRIYHRSSGHKIYYIREIYK
jgi:glycosyltransferase involved in cell wall biosynthesis